MLGREAEHHEKHQSLHQHDAGTRRGVEKEARIHPGKGRADGRHHGDDQHHAEAVAQHCAEDLGLDARALLTASRRRRTRSSLAATFLLSIGAITLLVLLSLLSERMRNDFDGLIMIFLLFVVIPALAFIVVLSVVIRLLWKRVASALSRLRNQAIG